MNTAVNKLLAKPVKAQNAPYVNIFFKDNTQKISLNLKISHILIYFSGWIKDFLKVFPSLLSDSLSIHINILAVIQENMHNTIPTIRHLGT